MPKGTEHQSQQVTKMLIIGDPGSGKTGACLSLLEAGYKFVIADFDNGLDVLISLARHKDPKLLENIIYETFTDEMKTIKGRVFPKGTPKAFSDSMNAMTKWEFGKEGEPGYYNLGNIGDWGPDTIFMIDSLTFCCKAAMRMILAINGRSGKSPWQSDYGDAQNLVEDMLALLYSTSVKCNVIVISHITVIGDEADGTMHRYPMSLGKALSPKVGSYFNTMVSVRNKGTGASAKRLIRTVSEGLLELKVPLPAGVVNTDLPIETGLATLFKELKGEHTGPAKKGLELVK